jgi:hypothetical protein
MFTANFTQHKPVFFRMTCSALQIFDPGRIKAGAEFAFHPPPQKEKKGEAGADDGRFLHFSYALAAS